MCAKDSFAHIHKWIILIHLFPDSSMEAVADLGAVFKILWALSRQFTHQYQMLDGYQWCSKWFESLTEPCTSLLCNELVFHSLKESSEEGKETYKDRVQLCKYTD